LEKILILGLVGALAIGLITPVFAISQYELQDLDLDGIPDVVDQCVHSDETYNKYQDDDGCPDVAPNPTTNIPIKNYLDADLDGISSDLVFGFLMIKSYNPDLRPVYSSQGPFPTYADNDKDGIDNSRDKCTYDREIYNGYMDEDGCPDEKPKIESYKKMAFDAMTLLNSKINAHNVGVTIAEDSLYSTWHEKQNAQAQLEKAWTSLWWAKKHLADSQNLANEGMMLFAESDYRDAYYIFEEATENVNKINPRLFEITSYITQGHNIQYE